jgi:hypothetical protein
LIAVTCCSSSCKKFLEQASQDLIRPVSVTHYKELLQGEAYFKDLYRNGWFVEVMSDNIAGIDLLYPTTVQNTKAQYAGPAYRWAGDLEEPTGTFTDRLFQHLYKNILTANSCLEAVDAAEGTAEEKQVLKGQAYFTRAYGYFVLANLYAQAYNEAAPTDLCVPLMLKTTPSLEGYSRATIKEIWDLISDDITQAVNLLAKDRGARSFYEVNYQAALLLATRVFLYKEDYDKVISYGERFLLLHPALRNITAMTTSPNPGGTIASKVFLYAPENAEVVFTFSKFGSAAAEGGYVYYTREVTGLAEVVFGASNAATSPLISSYGTNDRRKAYWFAPPTGAPGVILAYAAYTPMKVNYYDGCRTSQYMRSGEVYLNVAEAYARKASPDNGKAIDLLNQLRNNRIASYTNLTAAGFADQAALINFVWEERRRELCFEEFHRWWDLRRIGQPALQHEWLAGKKYLLNAKDPAYVLNFPRDEMEFNRSLVPNARPVREPQ